MSSGPADQEWSTIAYISGGVISIGAAIIAVLRWFAGMGMAIEAQKDRIDNHEKAIARLDNETQIIRNVISQMVTKEDMTRLEAKQDRQHESLVRAIMNLSTPQCRNFSPKD